MWIHLLFDILEDIEMVLRIDQYNAGFKIVSLAKDEETCCDLLGDQLDFVFIENDILVLYPEKIVLVASIDIISELKKYSNYDVFEIWPDGRMFMRFDTMSLDNFFFVTGKCNSNCVMCPSPEIMRKQGEETDIIKLIELAKHIPANVRHLTITGGEPFLSGEKIFEFISFLRDKFTDTECLFLTNGRIFSLDKYVRLLQENMPSRSIFAIPLHAADENLHDKITQARGSFAQTTLGIKRMLRYGMHIELRIVVSKLNCHNLTKLAQFIVQEISQIEYVSVIAMEMTGSAYKNKDLVWISYRDAFECAKDAIKLLIGNGINVRLYNFPLCTVNSSYWMICEKSISPNKVRYGEVCEACNYKSACGGVFAGTIQMEKEELKAIL